MLDQPSVLIKSDHRNVAQNGSFVLMNEMSDDRGAFAIELFIKLHEPFLLVSHCGILSRVNKPSFKEELPQCIWIHFIAHIRFLIRCFMQQGGELALILRAHVQNCKGVFYVVCITKIPRDY